MLTNNFIISLLTAVGACAISYAVIPVIINVSHLKGLFDEPDYRKLHAFSVPNLGGIAIFAAVLIIFCVSGYAGVSWAPYLVASLTILFFSGLKDDILVISPLKKLLLQCIAIGIIILGGHLTINNFGGVFDIGAVNYWVGFTTTFFAMVVVLNAYNLIDGIDGLSGGVGFIASLFFGIWFYNAGMMAQAVLAFAVCGSLVGFLRYNFQPARIFMGDTGSQVVGFLLAFLAVSFVHTGVSSTTALPFKNEVPVLVLAVLIVPLYDTLRVFTIRVLNGHSPFKADRRHVHHQLIDCGFSHRSSCLIIYGFNLIIIGMTIGLAGTNVNVLLGVILLSAIILFPTAQFKRKILKKMGINMPSADHILTLEQKIMIMPKSIGSNFEEETPPAKAEAETHEMAV